MPIQVALRHHTVYRYDRPVMLGPQIVRLRPAPYARTPILAYALTVLPAAHTLHWYQDPPGNLLARVLFPEAAERLELAVELTAELAETNPFDFFLEPVAVTWPFRYPALLQEELTPYLAAASSPPWLTDLLAGFSQGSQPTVDLLVGLNHHIRGRIAYVTRLEPGVQTPEETLALGSGSCRDSAWLLVQAARALGLAARFVSGYLIQLADPEKPVPEIEADGGDLHAWAEVYLPGAGWIGFDATSGLITGPGHIPVASTAHPASAAPLTGTVEASTTDFTFEMSVTRLPASS